MSTTHKNAPANRDSAKVSDRPAEQKTETATTTEKRRGRPAGNGEKKQTGKIKYPGVANGEKLSVVPTDFDPAKHKRLSADNFTSPALFDAHKAKHSKPRNFHPLLLNEAGEPENKLSEFPSDVSVEVSYDYSLNGEKIVAFRPRHFSDRRALAKALVPALQKQIAALEKISTMTDDQIEKLGRKEELKRGIEKKIKEATGSTISMEMLEKMLATLPPEMQEKYAAATAG